jgi:hypothetical protein
MRAFTTPPSVLSDPMQLTRSVAVGAAAVSWAGSIAASASL